MMIISMHVLLTTRYNLRRTHFPYLPTYQKTKEDKKRRDLPTCLLNSLAFSPPIYVGSLG